MPAPEVLRALLEYNPDTGMLFWKQRDASFFASAKEHKRWNSRYAGKRAFSCMQPSGYFIGAVLGFSTSAHRVAWIVHYGSNPIGQIDHVNGNTSDNRICNLRDVTPAQNSQNKRLKPSPSGFRGVRWLEKSKKWRAVITCNGVRVDLGCYSAIDSAIKARLEAEKRFGFHPNHGLTRRDF